MSSVPTTSVELTATTDSEINVVEKKTREFMSSEDYLQDYFKRLWDTVEVQSAVGYCLIIGIPEDDENDQGDVENDEDVEDKERNGMKEKKNYSKDQIDSLRHVVITKNRAKQLEKATDMATCGQAGDCCRIYNTQSGNDIIYGIDRWMKNAKSLRTAALRFDAYFALTFAINRNCSVWAQDNEMSGEGSTLFAVCCFH